MKPEMVKLERLLNLTAALLSTQLPLTAEQLRKRIAGYPKGTSAFRRMFERDKAELETMGIPIDKLAVPGTEPPEPGYRINPVSYEGGLRFDHDELEALHIANTIVRLVGGDDTSNAKHGVAGDDSVAETLRVRFHDEVPVLISAAADRKAVAFSYSDLNREVEPWRISFSRGHWYLTGWDRMRRARRMYRVDRIKGHIKLTDDATTPIGDVQDPGDLKPWEFGDADPVTARVAIDADRAVWARELLGEGLEQRADGRVIATLDVRDRAAFRSFVLIFLEHAEVLEPDELRQEMIQWLETMR